MPKALLGAGREIIALVPDNVRIEDGELVNSGGQRPYQARRHKGPDLTLADITDKAFKDWRDLEETDLATGEITRPRPRRHLDHDGSLTDVKPAPSWASEWADDDWTKAEWIRLAGQNGIELTAAEERLVKAELVALIRERAE